MKIRTFAPIARRRRHLVRGGAIGAGAILASVLTVPSASAADPVFGIVLDVAPDPVVQGAAATVTVRINPGGGNPANATVNSFTLTPEPGTLEIATGAGDDSIAGACDAGDVFTVTGPVGGPYTVTFAGQISLGSDCVIVFPATVPNNAPLGEADVVAEVTLADALAANDITTQSDSDSFTIVAGPDNEPEPDPEPPVCGPNTPNTGNNNRGYGNSGNNNHGNCNSGNNNRGNNNSGNNNRGDNHTGNNNR